MLNVIPLGSSHVTEPSLPLCLPAPGTCATIRPSASWNVFTLSSDVERPTS